jgi:hypothetical protein
VPVLQIVRGGFAMTSPRYDNFDYHFDAIVMFPLSDFVEVLTDAITARDNRTVNDLLQNFCVDDKRALRVSFPSEVAHDG